MPLPRTSDQLLSGRLMNWKIMTCFSWLEHTESSTAFCGDRYSGAIPFPGESSPRKTRGSNFLRADLQLRRSSRTVLLSYPCLSRRGFPVQPRSVFAASQRIPPQERVSEQHLSIRSGGSTCVNATD